MSNIILDEKKRNSLINSIKLEMVRAIIFYDDEKIGKMIDQVIAGEEVEKDEQVKR